MSITYTITTNFGAKDSLPTGDSNKIVRGSEFTTEFNAIKTAFSLAAPTASPTFTGTAEFNAITIGGVNVQTQLNAKAPLASPTFTGDATFAGIVEGIAADTTGGTYTLTGDDTIVTFDLTTSLNLATTSLAAGESVTVMFNTTSTITWPTGIKWVGGAAPDINTGLTTGQYQVVQIWKVGTTHYGAYTGELT